MLKFLKKLFSLIEAIALLVLIGVVVYNMGYFSGSSDGYVSGYFNGAGGIYAEAPSTNIKRTLKDDVSFAIKVGVSYIKDKIQTKKGFDELGGEFGRYDYVVSEPSVSNEITWRVQQSLNKIPSPILDNFVDNGWVVVISNEGFATEDQSAPNFMTTGLIAYVEKKIFVDGDSYGIDNTVAHEFGHYLDYVLDRPSEGNEWEACYQAEWERFYIINRNFHSIGTKSEYFAEVFALYLNCAEELKNACPLSYGFVDDIMSELIGE